jgi:hypothetical protein
MNERLLPSSHKLWEKSRRTLAEGHKFENGSVILDEPAWWGVGFDGLYCLDNFSQEVIDKTLNAVYAVKAKSADEAVDLLCAELGIKRPPSDFFATELYADEEWVDDPDNSYVIYKDDSAQYYGDGSDYLAWLGDQVEEDYEARRLISPQQELELVNAGKEIVRMVGMFFKPYYDQQG